MSKLNTEAKMLPESVVGLANFGPTPRANKKNRNALIGIVMMFTIVKSITAATSRIQKPAGVAFILEGGATLMGVLFVPLATESIFFTGIPIKPP